MMTPPPIKIEENTYFYHANGVTEGPVPLGLIKSLVLAGHLPNATMIKGKSENEWKKIDDLTNAQISIKKNSKESYHIFVVSLILSGVLVFFILARFLSDQESLESRKATTRTQPAATPRPASPETSYRSGSTPRTSPTPSAAITSATPLQQNSTGTSTGYSSGAVYNSETKVLNHPSTQPEFRTYTAADGTTYSVSNSDYYRLAAIREKISIEEVAIERAQNALVSLGKRIDSRRALVNSYSQQSVNDFNALVSQYERQRVQLNAKIDNFNQDVDSFNAELERVGRRLR